MKLVLFVVFVTSIMGSCSSDHEILLSQAFKQFESHGCVILISESDFNQPNHIKVPYINIGLSTLKRKDALFAQCGHIIVNLDMYKPSMQKEITSKLPATYEIVFISDDIDHVKLFPTLARLPLSLYYVRLNDSAVTIMRRPDILNENKIEILGILNDANYLGKTYSLSKLQLNFHGSYFPAVAFMYKPYSMPNYEDPSKHSGYEFEIASIVAESLNLKLEVAPPSSGFMWGSQNETSGNYTGLVGDLQHSVAEIGWAHLLITTGRLLVMDFTDWYIVEPACFLVKRRGSYHGVYSLIFPLESDVWFMILIVLIAFAAYYFVFVNYSQVGSSYSYTEFILYTCSVVLKESHVYSHKNTSLVFRLANITLILGMFLITTDYSGALVSFFSVEVYPKNPQTFEDLAEKVAKENLKIRICCGPMIDAMEESSMESFNLLSQPERRLPASQRKVKEAIVATYQFGHIYVHTKNALKIQKRVYNKWIPYDEVFIMKECFLPIQIALGLSFNSPFKMAINFRLAQLKEAGIINELVNEGFDMAGRVTNRVRQNTESYEEIEGENGVKYRQLDLTKVQGVFELHLCLLGISILGFTIEHWKVCIMKLTKVKVSKTIQI